jgi:hypothetical protein
MEQSVHITIEEGGRVALDEWVNGMVLITTDGEKRTGVIKHVAEANEPVDDIVINLELASNLIAEGENMIVELEEALPGAPIRKAVEKFYEEAKEQREKRRKEKRNAHD